MIVSFRSKALERFWWKGDVRRVDRQHVAKLTLLLSTLDVASTPQGMNVAGWRFHTLRGDQAGRYSVRVNANWRVTFGWPADGPDAVDVDYEDYH
jgi:toxin HigB-1